MEHRGNLTGSLMTGPSAFRAEDKMLNWKMHKGLMRSLQKTGCSHVLDVYCEGLTHQKGSLQQDAEFIDIQVSIACLARHSYIILPFFLLICSMFYHLPCSMKLLGGQETGISLFSFHIHLVLQLAPKVIVSSMKIYTGS